jgi:membrane-associated phospholipid phosphatase
MLLAERCMRPTRFFVTGATVLCLLGAVLSFPRPLTAQERAGEDASADDPTPRSDEPDESDVLDEEPADGFVDLSPASAVDGEAAERGDVRPEPQTLDIVDLNHAREAGGTARVPWTYREADFWDYGLVLAGFATMATTGLMSRSEVDGFGQTGFDEGARNVLMLRDASARLYVRDLSDLLLGFMIAYPIIVDGVFVAGFYRDSPETAFEIFISQMEVMAVTGALEALLNILANRERPYGRTCGAPGELDADTWDCVSDNRFDSFYSGHASQTFAVAASTCMNHAYLPLYGGTEKDVVPCVAGFGFAIGTALLRVMGDRHYLTDVMTGAALGTAVGLFLPWLMHYRLDARDDADEAQLTIHLAPAPSGVGPGVLGVF